jgi:hypothetical protein
VLRISKTSDLLPHVLTSAKGHTLRHLPGQGGWPDLGVVGVHADCRLFVNPGVGGSALVRGGRRVMDLCHHLGPIAGLGDELLLRKQVVREGTVQLPDLVQQLQFRGRVVAQVADEFADPGSVLLLDVRAVVLVGRGPVHRPSGGDVCDREREAELPGTVSPSWPTR